ncbi:MAG: alcohol dehydrogenase catalytic domain-containing protein [Microvirga sp.]|nr:alcohol dehydrogenase catalytic domain-containing protein [Microvirga sp.]
MRAIIQTEFGDPGVLRLAEMDTPRPKPNQVTLRVRACGVCGHDLLERKGVMRHGVAFPMVHGHEVAGDVVEVGEAVRSLKVGDRVASLQRDPCGHCHYCRRGQESSCLNNVFIGHNGTTGGYAEYMAIGERALVKLPPEVPYEHGAVLACSAGTILHAVREEAKVRPGDTVLVTGAGGGLGMHSVILAKLFGARVIATTTSEAKVDALKAIGADEVVVAPDNNFTAEVKSLTGGYGVDVVLDNVGAPVFKPALKVMAPYGRFIVIGQVTSDEIRFNPAFLIFKNISLIGSKSTHWQELEDMVELTRRGQFTPVIAAVMPLSEAREAHVMLEERRAAGRVVLVP